MTALHPHNSMNEKRRQAETGGAEFSMLNTSGKGIHDGRYTKIPSRFQV